MTNRRALAHLKWAIPVVTVLALAVGGRQTRQYFLARTDPQCSSATLQGTYDFAEEGLIRTASTPQNILNFAPMAHESGAYTVFDGTGKVKSIVTRHRFSHDNFVVTRTGSYKVNPNCTGEITWDNSTSGSLSQRLAVHRDGQSVDFMHTDVAVAGATAR